MPKYVEAFLNVRRLRSNGREVKANRPLFILLFPKREIKLSSEEECKLGQDGTSANVSMKITRLGTSVIRTGRLAAFVGRREEKQTKTAKSEKATIYCGDR